MKGNLVYTDSADQGKSNRARIIAAVFVFAVFLVLFSSQSNGPLAGLWRDGEKQDFQKLNILTSAFNQTSLALVDARTMVVTAYGYDEPAPDELRMKIELAQSATEQLYGQLLAMIKSETLVMAEGDQNRKLKSTILAMETNWKEYVDFIADVEADLASKKSNFSDDDFGLFFGDETDESEPLRKHNTRESMYIYTDLISSIDVVRTQIELQLMPEDRQLAAVVRLRHLLWNMMDYSGRKGATIGGRLADNEKIAPVMQEILAEQNGHIQAYWTLAKPLVDSIFEQSEAARMQKGIEGHLFRDYWSTVQDLVHVDIERGDRYPFDAEEWLGINARHAYPVLLLLNKLDRYADELSYR